jgi:hypothetical protein
MCWQAKKLLQESIVKSQQLKARKIVQSKG